MAQSKNKVQMDVRTARPGAIVVDLTHYELPGTGIQVDRTRRYGKDTYDEARLNWAGYGAVSVERATFFQELLTAALAQAAQFDGMDDAALELMVTFVDKVGEWPLGLPFAGDLV